MVRELAPGNEQKSQGVVVKPVVTMDVGRHLESFKITFNMEHWSRDKLFTRFLRLRLRCYNL